MLWLMAMLGVGGSAARAESVESEALPGVLTTLQKRTPGTVGVVTQNRGQEQSARDALSGAEGDVTFVRAGSLSEAPSALREAQLDCGVYLERKRRDEWMMELIGTCRRPDPVPVRVPQVEKVLLSDAEKEDRLLRSARAWNVSSALVYAASGGVLAYGIWDCRPARWAGGIHGCQHSPAADSGVFLGLSAIPLTVTGFKLVQVNRIRQRTGGQPLLSGATVLPAVCVALVAIPGYALDEATGYGFQLVGTTVALVSATVAVRVGRNEARGASAIYVGALPGGGEALTWVVAF